MSRLRARELKHVLVFVKNRYGKELVPFGTGSLFFRWYSCTSSPKLRPFSSILAGVDIRKTHKKRRPDGQTTAEAFYYGLLRFAR